MTLNGAAFMTVTGADGPKTLEFAVATEAVNILTFTYAPGANDAGAAEISDFVAPKRGLLMLVR